MGTTENNDLNWTVSPTAGVDGEFSSSGRWILPFPIPRNVSIIAVVFGTIINSCGLLGNVAIIGGIITSPRLRKAYNVFIGSLAVNDFLAIIFSNVFQMISYGKRTWPFNYQLCVFHYFAFMQFNLSTVLHILAIIVFRYITVVHPAAGRCFTTKTTVIATVVLLHMLPATVAIMPKIGRMDGHQFISQVVTCLPRKHRPVVSPLYILTALSFLVSVTLFVSHFRIHHLIKRTEAHFRRYPNGASSSSLKLARQKKHARVLKCMLVIFLLFAVSYFPFICIFMIKGPTTEHYYSIFGICLMWVSTGTNWVVYGVLDRDFREAYKGFLMFCRSVVEVTPTST